MCLFQHSSSNRGGSGLIKIQTKLFAIFCMSLDHLLLHEEIHELIFCPGVYERDHAFIYRFDYPHGCISERVKDN
jgi:hypothetical protein